MEDKEGHSDVRGLEFLTTILVVIFLIGGLAFIISQNGITGGAILNFENVSEESDEEGLVNVVFKEPGEKVIYLTLANKAYLEASFSVVCKEIEKDYAKEIFLDILDDGYVEYNGSCFGGRFFEFRRDLNAYVANCGADPCKVPIKVGSDNYGEIVLLDLELVSKEVEVREEGFNFGNAIKGFFDTFSGITGGIAKITGRVICDPSETDCADGMDNDCDVDVDCDDSDCFSDPACIEETYNAKMHFPQYPDPNGWDVLASYRHDLPGLKGWLADDWQSNETGNVTDIHLWGSWSNDTIGTIHNIHLGIHNDVPAQINPYGNYSMPDEPALWECDITHFNISNAGTGDQGWFESPDYYESSNHINYYRIDITDLSECSELFYQENGTIYWLDVWVNVSNGWWGWKTTLDNFNDGAVYFHFLDGWMELRDPLINESLDLAFVITGESEEPVINCTDNDSDGYNQSDVGCGTADCNDSNSNIYPGAAENCTNSVDDDCDSDVDCDDSECSSDPNCVTSPAVNITTCTNITLSGRYVLQNDIIDSSLPICINISADDVILDCQNKLIDGNDGFGSKGIYNFGFDNITIRNCVITNWDRGIYFDSYADYNTITNCSINENSAQGIYFYYYSNYNLIENSDVNNNVNYGVYLQYSSHNTVRNINSNKNTRGIDVWGGINNTIQDSNFIRNSNGLLVHGHASYPSENNTIINCTVGDNSNYGIYISASSNNVINNCLSYNNTNYGIILASNSDNNNITNLNSNNNPDFGIYMHTCSNNIIKNSYSNNNEKGVRFFSSSDNSIINTYINGNNNYSINFTDSPNNIFDANVVLESNISFNYSGDVFIKDVLNIPNDPGDYNNISKYLDISEADWLDLYLFYEDSDVVNITDESTLRMWKYDGSWNEIVGSNVDTVNNKVYANLTSFSIFAPMGEKHVSPPPAGNASYDNFNGTDFDNETDPENVSNATLENEEGAISWNEAVNSSGRDFDNDVIIGDGFVSVNVSALGQDWNTSANVTIYGTCPPIPIIYYSSGEFNARTDIINNGGVCDGGSDPACTNIRCDGNDLKFIVSHFSGLAIGQSIVVNNTSPACGAGTSHYSTIQKGINKANEGINTTVYVCPGTYKEDVILNKSIYLIGYGNKSQPIIINGVNTIMNISADNVYVENFTLSDTKYDASPMKFGLWIGGGHNNSIIKNVDIFNLSSTNTNVYGLFLKDSNNNTIGVNKIDDLYAPGTNGFAYGIYLMNSHNNTFVNLQNISNITARHQARGINVVASTNNTFSGDNLSIYKFSAAYTGMAAYGIDIESDSNNTVVKGINEILKVGYKHISNYVPQNAIGIYIQDSNNVNIIGNGSAKISVINATGTNGRANGIKIYSSNYVNISGITEIFDIDNIGGSNNNICNGIYLENSENNSFHDIKKIRDIHGGATFGNGIRLDSSHNNTFNLDNLIIRNVSISYTSASTYGIYLYQSSNNTFDGIGHIKRIGYRRVTYLASQAAGIYLFYSDNNTLIGNTTADIQEINTTGTGGKSRGIHLFNSDHNNLTGFSDITDLDNYGASNNDVAIGIYLDTSNNNTIGEIEGIKRIRGGAGTASGIYLYLSNDNVIYGQDLDIHRIEGGKATGQAIVSGIYFYISERNNITDLGGLTNIMQPPGTSLMAVTKGIHFLASNNNTIQGNGTVQIANLDASGTNAYAYGIWLQTSHHNNITGIGNITNLTIPAGSSGSTAYGINLGSSSSAAQAATFNIIKDPTISNISAVLLDHQFAAWEVSRLNTIHATFTPLVTSPKYTNTQTRFIHDDRILIDGVGVTPDTITDPVTHNRNITKYIDIPSSGTLGYRNGWSWIWLNITYTDYDLQQANVSEENLSVWKHPAAWTRDLPSDAERGVDTIDDYVWANVSSFASEIAPLSNGSYVPPNEITNCTVINAPGNYSLVNDIINSHIDCCINITANDVTFNGNGNIVDGDDVADGGICVVRSSSTDTNVIIRNVSVTDWDSYGVYLEDANENLLENLSLKSNPDDSIRLSSSSNNLIRNSDIYANFYGVYLTSSSDVNITNNYVNSTIHGIYITSSSTNAYIFNNPSIVGGLTPGGNSGVYVNSNLARIENNNLINGNYAVRVLSNGDYTIVNGNEVRNIIDVDPNGDYVRIINNIVNKTTISFQADHGFILNNEIFNGTCAGCRGILLSGDNVTVSNNIIHHVPNSASIELSNSNINRIINNTIYNGGQNGLYISNSDNNLIANNTIYNNSVSGGHPNNYEIYLAGSSENNIFVNNQINDSSGSDAIGIYFTATNNSFIDYNQIRDVNLSMNFSIASGFLIVDGVETPPADPSGYDNISKYIELREFSGTTNWVFLNISYEDSDVGLIPDESSIRMWRYNGTWSNGAYIFQSNNVDVVNNNVYANITQFSIFAPLGIYDTDALTITALNCTPNPANVSQSVVCNASIVEDVGIGTVFANVTHLNDTVMPQTVFCSGTATNQICNFTFSATTMIGRYNVTWWVNDTSGNEDNDTDRFDVIDVDALTITPVSCIPDPANISDAVVCNATVTDDVAVDTVLANVTHINSSEMIQNVICSTGLTSRDCNFTFVDTTLPGTYNVTWLANDTSANEDTDVDNFNVQDIDTMNLTAISCIPDPANISDSVVCTANATDDVAIDTVLANVTHVNGSILLQNVLCSGTAVYQLCNFTFTQTTWMGVYNVVWWVNDTSDNQDVDFDSFTVMNLPPSIIRVILNSTNGTNYTEENLTRYIIGLSDPEGDDIKNITNWYLNQTSLILLNMPFEGGSLSGNATGVPQGTRDYSMFANNGTVVNATWEQNIGYDSFGAYNFDGIDDFITVPDSDLWDFNESNVSISLWFNANSNQPNSLPRLLDHFAGGPQGWTIYMNDGNGKISVVMGADVDNLNLASGTSYQFNDSIWHHIVVTLNSTHGHLYIDGELNQSDNYSRLIDVNRDLYIGSNGGVRDFNGTIDDIVIYNKTLSAEQVEALFNNRTDLFISQETTIGEVWQACVTPNDGYQDGNETCSNNLTIVAPTVNQPPVIVDVILNSTFGTNYSNENLTRYLVGVSDPEGDEIKNMTTWYVNGSSIMILNMPFEGGSLSGNATGIPNATRDYTQAMNNGTAINVTWDANGGYDGFGAYEFDGLGDYIQTEVINHGVGTNNFAFEARIYPRDITGYSTIFSNAQYQPGIYLDYDNKDAGEFGIRWPGNGYSCNFNFSINTWYHIAVIRNGNQMLCYVDGSLTANVSINPAANMIDGRSYIGAQIAAADWFFNGTIDEVRLYNKSLSPQQVNSLFNDRTDLIVSADTSIGEAWQACVRPNDGYQDGNEACSNLLTILEPPEPLVQTYVNVTKADNPDPVDNGTNLAYSINLIVGDSNATNITLTEVYDDNVSFISAVPMPNISDNIWYLGSFIPGTYNEIINITVTVNESAPAGLVMVNYVNITYLNMTNDTLSDETTETTTVNVPAAQTNIIISKSDNPDPINNGTLLNYSISLTVLGNNASNITITETYSENVSFVSAVPAPDIPDNVWNFTDLLIGFYNQIINITVLVNSSTQNGTIVNYVNISYYNETGGELTDNTTETTTVIVVRPSNCGNSLVEPGETCDGADLSGRTCSDFDEFTGGILSCDDDCQINTSACTGGNGGGFCGDSIIQTSETCEGNNFTGLLCSDFDNFTGGFLTCDSCLINTSNCNLISSCGDGVVDPGEQCDDGNLSGLGCTDLDSYTGGTLSCDDNCMFNVSQCSGGTPGICGDGVVDTNETCDGTNYTGLLCTDFDAFTGGFLMCDNCQINTTNCNLISTCGNSLVEPGETCDDGNFTNLNCTDFDNFTGGGISCTNDCQINTTQCTGGVQDGFCGDGNVNVNETCDGTNYTGLLCTDFDAFTGGSLMCNADCLINTTNCNLVSACGDGYVDWIAGEQCDDGNLTGLGCTDIDSFTGGSLSCTDNCLFNTTACTGPPAGFCGDEIINPGEQCDDNGPNITNLCTDFDAFTGGFLTCGNCTLNMSQCSTTSICGNSLVEAGETCDLNNFTGLNCTDFDNFTGGSISCNADCQINTTQCTGGTPPTCGNGIIDTGETCEGTNFTGLLCTDFDAFTGGSLTCDSCLINTTNCNLVSACGDGYVDWIAGEQCDDGNLTGLGCTDIDSFTGGSLSCTDTCLYNTTQCTGTPPGICGDGVINPSEQCDDNSPNITNLCTDFDAYTGGFLTCENCTLNMSQCSTTSICGNSLVEAGETCDLNNFTGLNCTDFDNFTGGSITCNSDCQINTTQCTGGTPPICGDGIIDTGETCEGSNFTGLGCTDFDDFNSGLLTCTADCLINTSQCTTLIVVNQTNVTISKSDIPDPVNNGSLLNYSISLIIVRNNATNVTITEVYDSDVIFVSAVPAPSVGNNTWYLGDLVAGTHNQIINITVRASESASNGQILTNYANISYYNETGTELGDYTYENTTVNVPTTYTNVTITKSDNPDPVNNGSLLNYTISFTVLGNNATNVTIVDTYDENVSFVSSVPAPNTTDNTTWYFVGNLSTGTYAINVTVRVNESTPDGTLLFNTVNVSYLNATGGELFDNDTETTLVNIIYAVPQTNLNITKSDLPDPVINGSLLNYSITITIGDNNASNVTVTETYDSYVSFVSAIPAPSVGNNIWYLGDLVVGTYAINVTVRVNESTPNGTVLLNTVNVSYLNATGSELSDNDTETTDVDASGPIMANGVGWVYPTPANNAYLNVNNITLNLSCSDSNLDSVWIIFNGSMNFTYVWNHDNLPDGTYVFVGYCNDTAGNLAAAETRTITIDTIPPVVTLISPANGSTVATDPANFEYNVSDFSPIANCSLIIDDVIIQTNSTVLRDALQTFSQSLGNGVFNWSVNCTDVADNEGFSDTFTLIVNVPAPLPPGGGGGTGGGCNPNWVCNDWGYCTFSSQTRDCVDLNRCYRPRESPETEQSCSCYEDWICSPWNDCVGQVQSRICEDWNRCGYEVYKPATNRVCGSCNDWIQNQDETGIDCGGSCQPCPTCNDTIQNCHKFENDTLLCEEDIDCGGPCPPCEIVPYAIPTIIYKITSEIKDDIGPVIQRVSGIGRVLEMQSMLASNLFNFMDQKYTPFMAVNLKSGLESLSEVVDELASKINAKVKEISTKSSEGIKSLANKVATKTKQLLSDIYEDVRNFVSEDYLPDAATFVANNLFIIILIAIIIAGAAGAVESYRLLAPPVAKGYHKYLAERQEVIRLEEEKERRLMRDRRSAIRRKQAKKEREKERLKKEVEEERKEKQRAKRKREKERLAMEKKEFDEEDKIAREREQERAEKKKEKQKEKQRKEKERLDAEQKEREEEERIAKEREKTKIKPKKEMIIAAMFGKVKTKQKKLAKEREKAEQKEKEEEKRIAKEKEKERKAIEKEKEMKLHEEMKVKYTSQLNKFLEDSLARGYNENQIKNMLTERGWPKKFTNKYVRNYFKNNVKEVKVLKKEGELFKQKDIYEKTLEHYDEEIKKTDQGFNLGKWKKKGEGVSIKKASAKSGDKGTNNEVLEKLKKQMDSIDEDLETNKQYLKKELPKKWKGGKK